VWGWVGAWVREGCLCADVAQCSLGIRVGRGGTAWLFVYHGGGGGVGWWLRRGFLVVGGFCFCVGYAGTAVMVARVLSSPPNCLTIDRGLDRLFSPDARRDFVLVFHSMIIGARAYIAGTRSQRVRCVGLRWTL